MYYCYLLKNSYKKDKNRTYNGYTNNPKRRIRQHNQEITGGARYTKKYGNKSWEMYVLITGFPNAQNALQCEWKIKHPNNKRSRGSKYNSPSGRIKGLNEVLQLNRWTSQSTIDNDFPIDVWVLNEYAHLLTIDKKNITIHAVEKINFETININNIYTSNYFRIVYHINIK